MEYGNHRQCILFIHQCGMKCLWRICKLRRMNEFQILVFFYWVENLLWPFCVFKVVYYLALIAKSFWKFVYWCYSREVLESWINFIINLRADVKLIHIKNTEWCFVCLHFFLNWLIMCPRVFVRHKGSYFVALLFLV